MASANFIGILNLQVREVHSENRGYDLTGKETFVKVELANTNGIPNKKRTKAVTSSGVSTLFFDHMRFEVQDTDTELLIKLCVKKNKVKPAVVSDWRQVQGGQLGGWEKVGSKGDDDDDGLVDVTVSTSLFLWLVWLPRSCPGVAFSSKISSVPAIMKSGSSCSPPLDLPRADTLGSRSTLKVSGSVYEVYIYR